MSEEMQTSETTTTTSTPATTEAPAANSPEARSTTGEIKDVRDTVETKVEPKAETTAAPESYTDFTLPEGHTLDPKLVSEATPLFKELGLSQESAQKLVDFHTKFATSQLEAAKTAYDNMRSDWVSQVKADKELGPILEQKVIPAIGQLKEMMPKEVREAFTNALDFTGGGDHPGIVKGLYTIAKLLTESGHVHGGSPSKHGQSSTGQQARPTIAGAMYPNLPN